MKSRTLVSILIFILAVLIIRDGYATDKKVTKRDYRFVEGTWTNEEYNSHPHMGKYVLRRDGTFDSYFTTSDTEKEGANHYIIVEKWTDSEGSIWYKMHEWAGIMVEGKPTFYSLNKFSNSGKIWEFIWLSGEFPTEFDENNFHYHIYYRQE